MLVGADVRGDGSSRSRGDVLRSRWNIRGVAGRAGLDLASGIAGWNRRHGGRIDRPCLIREREVLDVPIGVPDNAVERHGVLGTALLQPLPNARQCVEDALAVHLTLVNRRTIRSSTIAGNPVANSTLLLGKILVELHAETGGRQPGRLPLGVDVVQRTGNRSLKAVPVRVLL